MLAGLLVAGVLAFTIAAYRRDLGRAREGASAGSRVAETSCGPIEYASVGEGPAILLVHGAGGGFDQALPFAHLIVPAGYRAVAMSRFGYLRTPLPADGSPEAQADAHACLLDALGIPRVAGIVGISAGGPSSLQFALRHPERTARLVLLAPLAYAPRPETERLASASTRLVLGTALKSDFLFWLAAKVLRRTLVRAVLGTPPEILDRASAKERARAMTILESIQPVSARQHGLLNDAAVATSLPRYALERIATPTLAISCEDDLYGTYPSARYTAEHVPGARFVGYPSGGHLWVGHHEEVMGEILAFLGSGSASPARGEEVD
jgi:pimeloyl-ACP methyl ester carboxylesterase